MAFEKYQEYTLECDHCFDSLIDMDGRALHGPKVMLIVAAQRRGWLYVNSMDMSYCPECRNLVNGRK